MKRLITSIAIACSAISGALAQDSLRSEQPFPGEPQGQYGTQVPGTQGDVKEDRVEVSREQLPPAMQTELDQNSTYEGWEAGNVYFERNSNQFIVHIVRENTTHTFRFDKDGNAIRTQEPLTQPTTTQ